MLFTRGRMNQRLSNSLTAALLITAIWPIASSHAAQTQAVGQSTEAKHASVLGEGKRSPASLASAIGRPSAVEISQYHPQASAFSDTEAIAKVTPHVMAGQNAATLSVRNIPVLTFLGATEDDATSRAKAIAAQINQMNRDNVDANSITVSPYEGDTYLIKINGQELVAIDAQTILPDTTQNPAEDALQATNRLRRLLGKAAPLQKIPGITISTAFKNPDVEESPGIAKRPLSPNPDNATDISPEPILMSSDGWASWYGPGFDGNYSANGEIFNQNDLTAAHRDLPFGTWVRVTNLDNGLSVVVRINDRGPFIEDRIIDLSAAAAETIGMMDSGVAPVRLDVLGSQNTAIAN